MAKSKAKKKDNIIHCYFCGEPVSERELVKKDFLVKGKERRFVERLCHADCAVKLYDKLHNEEATKNETYWWDKSYHKMKEILNTKENLDTYTVMRLRSLTVDEFIVKGDNVVNRDVGYDYETLYYTILFCEQAMRESREKITFNDSKHEINYLLKILEKKIGLVRKRLLNKQEQEERIERLKDSGFLKTHYEYIKENIDEEDDGIAEAINRLEDEIADELGQKPSYIDELFS